MELRVREHVKNEITDITFWYEKKSAGLGEYFLRALNITFELIKVQPKSFPKVYCDVRRVLTKRFPYVVYYRYSPSEIEILAVVHSSRKAPELG